MLCAFFSVPVLVCYLPYRCRRYDLVRFFTTLTESHKTYEANIKIIYMCLGFYALLNVQRSDLLLCSFPEKKCRLHRTFDQFKLTSLTCVRPACSYIFCSLLPRLNPHCHRLGTLAGTINNPTAI